MNNCYFCIVAADLDLPIYEAEFYRPEHVLKGDENRLLPQFIAQAALDTISHARWAAGSSFLKNVDRYNEWTVSAFLTASGDRLILVHEGKSPSEEAIRNFFIEVHELYTKITINPFYRRGDRIGSSSFEVKVRVAGKKYLEK